MMGSCLVIGKNEVLLRYKTSYFIAITFTKFCYSALVEHQSFSTPFWEALLYISSVEIVKTTKFKAIAYI